jgi:hypothetical protein
MKKGLLAPRAPKRGWLGLAAIAVVVLVATAGAANLPGGTSISVTIAGPADNATLPDAPVTVTGSAAVGTGAPIADTTLIYVVDLSGSTSSPIPAASAGSCPNQNAYDTFADTTLDCELLAIRRLNTSAIGAGTVAEIGLIGFAGGLTDTTTNVQSAKIADLAPSTGAPVPLAAPAAFDPTFHAGPGPFTPATNLDWVLQGTYLAGLAGNPVGWPLRGVNDGFTLFTAGDVGIQTNYSAAILKLKDLLATVHTSKVLVAFLSDGVPNVTVSGISLATILNQLPSGAKIDTFAIGASASCGSTPPADLNGSLAQISAHQGGKCTRISNPADASAIVPGAVSSSLNGVSLSVDGGPSTPATVAPPLPRTGPATVSWSSTLHLAPRSTPYEICANAAGQDGGGTGSATDCTHVTIKARPTAAFSGPPPTGLEGSAIPIAATVTGDPTTTWSMGPMPRPDFCTIADPHALSTTVTCADNGDYVISLTASDGVNTPPTEISSTVHVANADPVATLSATPALVPVGGPVDATVSITDPGADDTHTCTIDWGDGSLPASTCTASHAYATPGTKTISAVGTDDDGGASVSTATVEVKAPPSVTVGAAGSVGEGSPFAVSGTVTGATSVNWSSSGGTGTCTFADPSAATTSVTCDDNGTYALTLTGTDAFSQTGSATQDLQVANVAPQVTAHAVGGPNPVAQQVSASWSFSDPSTHDTHTCSINWGDGSPAQPAPAAGGTCSAGHTYAAGGSFTATATITDDDGGAGSDSVAIAIDGAPSVSAGANTVAAEGALVTLNGLVTDDHGATSLWTAVPGAGVDSGAVCTFGNALSPNTTVSCSDDGTWTLTLTASDGVNPSVGSSATLTLSNAAPTVSITSATVGAGSTVSVVAAIADAGGNDPLACSINWGDGTTTAGTIAGHTCTSSHTYTGTGPQTITVTASDDDGGSAQATTTVTLNRPPVCSAVKATPNTLWEPNGDFELVLLSGGTDPEGARLTYTVTGVTQDEPLTSTKRDDDDDRNDKGKKTGPKIQPDAKLLLGPLVLIRAERDGKGDGRVYTVAYRLSDGQASCVGTVRVTVPHDKKRAAVLSPYSYNSLG